MAALRRPAAEATRDRHLVELPALGARQAGRRRLLDELLVTALDRAVALAERDDGPVAVAEQLDLDVAGGQDLALEVDRAVAEGRGGLGRSGDERSRQVGRRARRGASRGRRRRRRP